MTGTTANLFSAPLIRALVAGQIFRHLTDAGGQMMAKVNMAKVTGQIKIIPSFMAILSKILSESDFSWSPLSVDLRSKNRADV